MPDLRRLSSSDKNNIERTYIELKLTGAEILMECLLEQEVDTVFGYPGGTILYVYDALVKYRGMSRERRTLLTDMPAAPERWGWRFLLRDPVRPT